MQQRIARLFGRISGAAGRHGVEQFVALFAQHIAQGQRRLAAVPRAAVGGQQAFLDCQHARECGGIFAFVHIIVHSINAKAQSRFIDKQLRISRTHLGFLSAIPGWLRPPIGVRWRSNGSRNAIGRPGNCVPV